MRVKLEYAVEGKHGTYPPDTWLDAVEDEGFIYIRYAGHPGMAGKRIARCNIKEIEKDEVRDSGRIGELRSNSSEATPETSSPGVGQVS